VDDLVPERQALRRGSHARRQTRGPFKRWLETGALETEAEFRDGKLEGRKVEWYANGRKKSEGNYHANLRQGACSHWLESGEIDPANTGNFVDDVKAP